jgi:L,D-transpeptidase ErfK/SrfK
MALLAVSLAGGCRLPQLDRLVEPEAPRFDEALFAGKPLRAHVIPAGPEDGPPEVTVIGQPRTHRIRPGETLLDAARWHDLGYNEIVEANPDVDPWLPPEGATIVVPTTWVLPCCTYEGIVVNIPEMRLYQYERVLGGRQILVRTHPVGLGRLDWRTPRGALRIAEKAVNPRWDIPESIRQEHIRERGDPRTFIPGGDPENPLGAYRMRLSLHPYSIHGTNMPWGVGVPASHGCVRMYPEDIARFFPLVAVGTPVLLTYQPVKVGRGWDGVWVEVHRDLYGYSRTPYADALRALERRRLGAAVDRERVKAAVEAARGVPLRIDTPAAPRPS